MFEGFDGGWALGASRGAWNQIEVLVDVAFPESLLEEQRQRAEARLDRDKASLQVLEAKIKQDESRVAELKRIEAERGGEANAVTLRVLPEAGGGSGSVFPQ